MAVNDEVKDVLPSLLDAAYNACNDMERKQYTELPGGSVDFQICCQSILKLIHINSNVEIFNPSGDRLSMFPKVQHLVQPQFSDHYLIKNICEMAAFHGHLDCMKLARSMGVPWHSPTLVQKSACDRAAESGNLQCLIYAHLNGARWCEFTCSFAAEKGHLDCLKYLHNNGCPWDEKTCSNAAKNGHMQCLIYARENDCPWDEDTCSMAAMGELEILKYCRENGCPWNSDTCYMAAISGQLRCLKYARENRCPWNIEEYLKLPKGFKNGDILSYALKIRAKRRRRNQFTR